MFRSWDWKLDLKSHLECFVASVCGNQQRIRSFNLGFWCEGGELRCSRVEERMLGLKRSDLVLKGTRRSRKWPITLLRGVLLFKKRDG